MLPLITSKPPIVPLGKPSDTLPEIRNSLDFASWKDRKSVPAALKEVYRAPSAEAAAVALDAFDTSPWGTKYPPIAALGAGPGIR